MSNQESDQEFWQNLRTSNRFFIGSTRLKFKAINYLPAIGVFAFLIGGVVCPRCGAHTQPVKPISMEALRYPRHFQRSNYNAALKAHPSPQVKEEMEQLMQAYFSYTLERHINTVDFLRDVKKPPANGG